MNRSAARLLVVAAAIAATTPILTTREVGAAPGDTNEIVAVVVDGVGNGHGRGLSQWGSYGWAVNYGWDWTQILDHYYGGTSLGDAANNAITVRLLALDDQLQTAVISATGTANWGGTGSYGALVTREVDSATRRFQVWGHPTPTCPTAEDPLAGWTYLGEVSGAAAGAPAVEFTTPAGDNPGAAPGDLLGVCGAGGVVDHYRGSIYAANGTVGENRTVNRVLIESYLRGVVPRESPASWGLAGGGAGANALRAQSVAARSYALTQGRYSYANTCDSSACQVYGGAGWRVSASSPTATTREHELTDAAIVTTAGKIRVWPGGGIVSTEFSASNGPRTAGGSFPAVDDPADAVADNPLHRWTRVIDANALAERFDLGTLTAAYTERDPATLWDGQWGNRVQLQGTTGATTMSALSFRGSYGLPSHGISIRVITREMITPQDFAFIGDSVGFSITDTDTSELPALLDGVFASTVFDSVGGRCTAAPNCIGTTGVQAAQAIPNSTEIAIVELGYNDPSGFAAKIDQVMSVLRGKGVTRVGWVTMSERRASSASAFAAANQALNAARARWPELVVLDWDAASSGADRDRWYADGVHLTTTGQSEFALWLRSQVLALATAGPGKLGAGRFLRVKIPGVGDVPSSGVTAVALNVTAVDPSGWGFFTVWPCGSPMPPDASHVNFLAPGAVEPNSVLALVDATGEVCVWTYAASHVLVDVNGWFTSGFRGRTPLRIVDTRSGQGAPVGRLPAGQTLRVPVAGKGGIPLTGASAVALNVTAVEPTGWGFFTVWPCGSPMPLDASHVNFVDAGAVEPNSVLAPIDSTGEVCIWSYADAHVLVDINGWFTSGFEGRAPDRIVDTREGRGAPLGKLGAGQTLRVPVSGVGDVPASGVKAVALNVTAAETAGWGFFTVWPCGSPMPPDASHVNFIRSGAVEPNSVLVPVDFTGEVCIWTYAPAHVLVDVNGWFTAGFEGRAPQRFVDTRSGQFTPL
ncbi:MAG TPA: SpoIID/LytB domain-containing protein [Ilumatobacteraceae bacterium]|nr:SpoIID/LytB domain-containing protein [Ilumatobacteraceae bacterium]